MDQDLTPNPYASSATAISNATSHSASVDFMPIVKGWEVLRLWYNGVLILYVLVLTISMRPEILLETLFWFHLCVLGAISNLFFCFGPTAEGYGRCLGVWNPVLRKLIFFLGLCVTVALATIFLIVRLR